MLAHAKGYKAHILLPSDIATEKVDLLEKLGATVERVKPASIVDKEQFVNLARRRAEERGGGLFADQFENEVNWKCHAETTGPEIYRQCGGRLDAVVSGVGIIHPSEEAKKRYRRDDYRSVGLSAPSAAEAVGCACGSIWKRVVQ